MKKNSWIEKLLFWTEFLSIWIKKFKIAKGTVDRLVYTPFSLVPSTEPLSLSTFSLGDIQPVTVSKCANRMTFETLSPVCGWNCRGTNVSERQSLSVLWLWVNELCGRFELKCSFFDIPNLKCKYKFKYFYSIIWNRS